MAACLRAPERLGLHLKMHQQQNNTQISPKNTVIAEASLTAILDIFFLISWFSEATAISVADSLALRLLTSSLVLSSSASSLWSDKARSTSLTGLSSLTAIGLLLPAEAAGFSAYTSPTRKRSPKRATASFTDRNGRLVSISTRWCEGA
ncbi:hypothetical protein EJ110_NYTH49188 [Nymphaea thermarum]|nr:hypothetical protein EJ110_NYTH49188 [Nymphaea thermarum]